MFTFLPCRKSGECPFRDEYSGTACSNACADGHVAILISHTGKNERLAEIAGMLRKGGTKVIVISAVRDGIVSKQADEFLYAAGSGESRRVLEFNVLCFGKISAGYLIWHGIQQEIR
ncbi:MAG: SIS domain-containing protein [Blautia wexlerae]